MTRALQRIPVSDDECFNRIGLSLPDSRPTSHRSFAIRYGLPARCVGRAGNSPIIKDEGFIDNYRVIEDNKQGQIKIYLKYLEDGKPVMEALKRISKPGRREYVPADKVASVMGGVGITILSTSKGLLTDAKAREEGIGGEAICTIW